MVTFSIPNWCAAAWALNLVQPIIFAFYHSHSWRFSPLPVHPFSNNCYSNGKRVFHLLYVNPMSYVPPFGNTRQIAQQTAQATEHFSTPSTRQDRHSRTRTGCCFCDNGTRCPSPIWTPNSSVRRHSSHSGPPPRPSPTRGSDRPSASRAESRTTRHAPAPLPLSPNCARSPQESSRGRTPSSRSR